MTKYSNEGQKPSNPNNPNLPSITRVGTGSPVMTVDQACEADFRYFMEHPEEDQYIREFCPGEFGKKELPELPEGYRFAILVTVTLRVDGQPVGRFREMMAICENVEELEE
jgi:hypothetical protein